MDMPGLYRAPSRCPAGRPRTTVIWPATLGGSSFLNVLVITAPSPAPGFKLCNTGVSLASCLAGGGAGWGCAERLLVSLSVEVCFTCHTRHSRSAFCYVPPGSPVTCLVHFSLTTRILLRSCWLLCRVHCSLTDSMLYLSTP